jgi:DNA-binding transcriptional regulator GbsR (MarR family)
VPGEGEVSEAIKVTHKQAILIDTIEPILRADEPGQSWAAMDTTVLTSRGLVRTATPGTQTELGQTKASSWESLMTECYYAEKLFIENISRHLEQMGLPRMAGRVLGALLVSNPPEQSLNDLREVLQASKGALSTATRLLAEMGLIERVPSLKPREVAYRFKAGGSLTFMRMRLRLMASLHQVAGRGWELVKDQPPTLRERLQEAHDMFSQIEQALLALLGRIENER